MYGRLDQRMVFECHSDTKSHNCLFRHPRRDQGQMGTHLRTQFAHPSIGTGLRGRSIHMSELQLRPRFQSGSFARTSSLLFRQSKEGLPGICSHMFESARLRMFPQYKLPYSTCSQSASLRNCRAGIDRHKCWCCCLQKYRRDRNHLGICKHKVWSNNQHIDTLQPY